MEGRKTMAKSMEYQRYWKKKEIKSTHGQKGRSNQNQIEPEKMRTQKNLRKEEYQACDQQQKMYSDESATLIQNN